MRRAVIIASALLAAAATAPAAGAATLTVDHGCYLIKQPVLPNGQAVVARADGFTPGQTVTFSEYTGPVAAATADPSGSATVHFATPSLPSSQFQATRTLTASDGANHASATLQLRALAADFRPATTTNALRQRVRFSVYGFGPVLTAYGRSTRQPVYMHVFEPPVRRKGKLRPARLRGTFAVGRTSGPCGDLQTGRRKILPFGSKEGTWTYRFTTSRRYRAAALPQVQAQFRVCTVFVLPGSTRPPGC